MNEYRKIPNSKYEINMLGQVRRVYKNGNISHLKHSLGLHGYYTVTLENRKKVTIHRLLGLMFIDNPDPENKTMIDHIDRNKQNNTLSNLRWVTCSENNINREKNGCITRTTDKIKHNGKEYTYNYYRVWLSNNKKRTSKRFKKYEDAHEYLQNKLNKLNN